MRFMNTLDKYIFCEIIPPFFASILFCLLVFVMRHLLIISEMIASKGTNFTSICLLIIYAIPYFLQYVIPMSVIISVLTVCSNMSENNEIIAIKANGLSIYKVVKPVILFASSAMIVTGIVTVFALPLSEKLFKSLSHNILTSSIRLCLKERIFNSHFNNSTVYIGHMNRKDNCMYDIYIENISNDKVKNVIIAPKGKLITVLNGMKVYLKLFNGSFISIDTNELIIQHLNFETYNMHLDTKDILSENLSVDKTVKEMNLSELTLLINSKTEKDKKYYESLVQYHKIFSIPFSCLSMSILALSFGVNNRKIGKFFSITLGIIMFLGHYFLFSVCVILSESGFYNPAILIYLPNILTSFVGGCILILEENGIYIV